MSWSAALHFTIVFILALLMAGFQTSFWFQIFGALTPPLLWLIVFTYIILYREGVSAIFQLTFLALMLVAFSASSVKVFYSGLVLYFIFIYFLKSRVFWSGPGYFLIVCSVGAVAYHIIFYILSFSFENSRSDILILERLTQVLLTPAFSFPVYWILNAVDGLFVRRELKADIGGSTYE